jgi:hypothetical protein
MEFYDTCSERTNAEWQERYNIADPNGKRTLVEEIEGEEIVKRNGRGVWGKKDEGRTIRYMSEDGTIHQVEILMIDNSRHKNLATEVNTPSDGMSIGCRPYLNLPRCFEKLDRKLSQPRNWYFVDLN